MKLLWIVISACALILGCGTKKPVSTDMATKTDTSSVAKQQDGSNQGSVAEKTMVKLTYAQRQGKGLFLHYCSVCHGEGGAGDGFNAFNLAPVRPRDLADQTYMTVISDLRIQEVIREGGRGTRKSVLMPAWGNTLNEAQVQDLVAFIRTLEH